MLYHLQLRSLSLCVCGQIRILAHRNLWRKITSGKVVEAENQKEELCIIQLENCPDTCGSKWDENTWDIVRDCCWKNNHWYSKGLVLVPVQIIWAYFPLPIQVGKCRQNLFSDNCRTEWKASKPPMTTKPWILNASNCSATLTINHDYISFLCNLGEVFFWHCPLCPKKSSSLIKSMLDISTEFGLRTQRTAKHTSATHPLTSDHPIGFTSP